LSNLNHYRHFKGGLYEIVCEATLESDPSITMIIYKNATGSIWARPSDNFFQLVEKDGKTVPRFALIDR